MAQRSHLLGIHPVEEAHFTRISPGVNTAIFCQGNWMIFTDCDINYFEILLDEVVNELRAVESDISLSPLPKYSPVPTAKHVQLPIPYKI